MGLTESNSDLEEYSSLPTWFSNLEEFHRLSMSGLSLLADILTARPFLSIGSSKALHHVWQFCGWRYDAA